MRSVWKKVRRLEKSTPPPVVAVVTNMSCDHYLFFWSLLDDSISCPHAEVTLGPFTFAKDFHSSAQQVVFHSLGCTRARGQMEEPHAEPSAMVKE